LLGAGGMGEVYRAKDTRLGREVAVKVLPEALAGDETRLARFQREARTVAGLSHPNVVVLYSVEEERGIHFLTMELVEGQDLGRVVKPGGLPLARVLELAIPLADALAAAHERGVVHRDLKPGNVMVTREGRVKVLDFGLATSASAEGSVESTQAATAASPLSAAGQVMGTVPYMAPEQVRGEGVDARTDLFAFGSLVYELVTGRRPFAGETSADISSSILRDSPTPVQALRPDLPPDIGRIIGRCLEKDPERRVQTAKDVRNELELVRRATESGSSPAFRGGAPAVGSANDLPSIAVLPFANRGRDEEDEYFADGITEDVIAQLCKVRTLKVISRSSVMPFRDREEGLQSIASRLQVAHVLEGSVRRLGDRVRIVAQLIDAGSGQHLWAETYDRRLTDIFAIQSEVALHIAEALTAELSPVERDRMRRQPTLNVEAYEMYQRGRKHYVRYTAEDMLRSLEFFDKAIALDPDFALAHVGIAVAYTELGETGTLGRAEAGARAIAAAERAVTLDSELAEAHCARAYARLGFEFEWAGAEAGFRRALELSPGSALTYDLYGRMCAGLERFDEAIALHERAYELDPITCRTDLATSYLRAGRNEDAARVVTRAVALEPRDSRLRATLGWALFRQGRVEEGLAELELAAGLTPGEEMWLAQLGQACALAGKTEKAREILGQLEDPSRPAPASLYHLAYVHTGLGDADRAMDCLERAFEKGTGALFGMKGSFLLAPLRHHPRFVALLKRMRLA
jgi:serine/threonine protein kinase/tetratricopeptide (TPR) repeat protein